ncbi:Anditomin synthesis protein L [Penicillium diatomitis]|uniref:Anditomin synthesis protein L n=1 Tax=Penicillium diatomitis TaxID=2819901 RepID=A0A9W9XD98_9EURO|nr:Anditomin synthesis protein L [Penicillium diatomitis]KAJ5489091.1 Anditomin synthesis protein L [Penicillium diatomitis]
MRGLDENSNVLHRVGHTAGAQVKNVWLAFVNFAARDNVLEVALGLIIANAFTKVVSSFVSDVVLPVVSLLPLLNRNMDQKFAVLSPGPNYVEEHGYNTLKQARDDGALVLAWGMFVETLLNFAGVSLTLFAVAHLYMFVSHDKIIKPTVRCRYCRKFISVQAKRCVNCSTWQDGREDLPGETVHNSDSDSIHSSDDATMGNNRRGWQSR